MSEDFIKRAYKKWDAKYKGDESLYMEKYCPHCGDTKKDCTGYKCWIA